MRRAQPIADTEETEGTAAKRSSWTLHRAKKASSICFSFWISLPGQVARRSKPGLVRFGLEQLHRKVKDVPTCRERTEAVLAFTAQVRTDDLGSIKIPQDLADAVGDVRRVNATRAASLTFGKKGTYVPVRDKVLDLLDHDLSLSFVALAVDGDRLPEVHQQAQKGISAVVFDGGNVPRKTREVPQIVGKRCERVVQVTESTIVRWFAQTTVGRPDARAAR